ncbi:MAG: DNA primase [Mobiluncus porci]|uniref:DNA primase n=1 Tax=Mobiluncus TaxID=2050 RepID=UPI0023F2B158|nr:MULTISPECIES: DNA primase [Mobiluncus]MCI6584371.1 DNA primase [Mobiluncus sp.]MDD7541791.1 DNA primase [Mobiluncus porci]MDY5748639.1 DNA primase [Mobiluncus porci]
MSKDPRHALDNLIAALERHLEIAVSLEGEVEDSEVLLDAENKLRDAFFTYDDTLFTMTGAELPFDILDDDDLDEESDDDLDEDDLEDDLEDEDDFDDDDDEDDYLGEDDLEDFDLLSDD